MRLLAIFSGAGAVAAAFVGVVYGIPISGPVAIVLVLVAIAADSELRERPYDWQARRDL